MNTMNVSSLIGVTGCRKTIDGYEFDCAGHKYLAAVEAACNAVALIVPTSGDDLDRRALLSRIDGLMFTGSPSNVEPHHYGGDASADGTLHDSRRDATALPLIRDAVEQGVPVLCICRGFQEMNVAFGGSLYQRTYEVDGLNDHREDPDDRMNERYAAVHGIKLREGGKLSKLAGCSEAMVNSLHAQGIDRLGDGLEVEAWASDGLIEAVSVKDVPAFAMGVQWHPEWKVKENPFYGALFEGFASACRERQASLLNGRQQKFGNAG